MSSVDNWRAAAAPPIRATRRDEGPLAEPPIRLRTGGQRLRHERRHAGRLAGNDLLAIEVAAIRDDRQRLWGGPQAMSKPDAVIIPRLP
jgi:hypothetical protein